MSDVREDFLKMWNVGSRSEEVVSLPSTDSEFSTMNATSLLDSLKFEDPGSFLVTTTLLVLSFLSASFATLDNSTLRLDLSLSLHVESLATGFLYFSNHIDRVLRVSPDDWMHLDSTQPQKMLQSSKPGLNVGFDFATILSSPCPCCFLFAIVFGQLAELKFSEQQTDLKWLMLHKWRRLSHSSRVKLPFVSMSASCVWCRHFWFESSDPNPNWSCQTTNPEQLCGFWTRVSLLDSCLHWSSGKLACLILRLKIQVEPFSTNFTRCLCGSSVITGEPEWRESRCFEPSAKQNNCFIVFKDVEASQPIEKTSRLRKHNRQLHIQDRCTELESQLGSQFVFLMVCHAASFPAHSLWIFEVGWRKNATLQKPNPKDQEREFHPCVDLHQER